MRDQLDELEVQAPLIFSAPVSKKIAGQDTVYGKTSKFIADWFKDHPTPSNSDMGDLVRKLRGYGINAYTQKG